jgi:hypothetical protein
MPMPMSDECELGQFDLALNGDRRPSTMLDWTQKHPQY